MPDKVSITDLTYAELLGMFQLARRYCQDNYGDDATDDRLVGALFHQLESRTDDSIKDFQFGNMERLARNKHPEFDEIQASLEEIATKYELPIAACVIPESDGYRGLMAVHKNRVLMLEGMRSLVEYSGYVFFNLLEKFNREDDDGPK